MASAARVISDLRLRVRTGGRRFLDAVPAPLWAVVPSVGLYANALAARTRYGFGCYDSIIVAAASAAGCTWLLSE